MKTNKKREIRRDDIFDTQNNKKKITKMNKGEIIFGKEKDGFRT